MRSGVFILLLSVVAFAEQEPEGRAAFIDASLKYHSNLFTDCIEGYRKTVALHHEVPFSKMMIARCYALLGDSAAGIEALDEAAEFEFLGAQVLETDPDFTNLRSHPRFTEIVAKVRVNASRPCAVRANRRQFDFWTGEWIVTNARDQVIGTDVVESIDGGCTIRETWTGASGDGGRSMSYYDRLTGYWRQVWMDPSGTPLDLYGEWLDGSLQFRQVTYAGGVKTIYAVRYTPQEDGTVKQLAQRSNDDGTTWITVSNFTFTRKQQ